MQIILFPEEAPPWEKAKRREHVRALMKCQGGTMKDLCRHATALPLPFAWRCRPCSFSPFSPAQHCRHRRERRARGGRRRAQEPLNVHCANRHATIRCRVCPERICIPCTGGRYSYRTGSSISYFVSIYRPSVREGQRRDGKGQDSLGPKGEEAKLPFLSLLPALVFSFSPTTIRRLACAMTAWPPGLVLSTPVCIG